MIRRRLFSLTLLSPVLSLLVACQTGGGGDTKFAMGTADPLVIETLLTSRCLINEDALQNLSQLKKGDFVLPFEYQFESLEKTETIKPYLRNGGLYTLIWRLNSRDRTAVVFTVFPTAEQARHAWVTNKLGLARNADVDIRTVSGTPYRSREPIRLINGYATIPEGEGSPLGSRNGFSQAVGVYGNILFHVSSFSQRSGDSANASSVMYLERSLLDYLDNNLGLGGSGWLEWHVGAISSSTGSCQPTDD